MAREVESDPSGIRFLDRITTKSSSILPIGGSTHNTKFIWSRLITFAVILHTVAEWHNK